LLAISSRTFSSIATRDRFVQVALAANQFDLADDDRLRRQLACHLFLLAAQDERADPLREQLTTVGVALLLDRRPPVLGKGLIVAEESGQQEVELTPELAEVVFQRRAGQAKAVAGDNPRTTSAPWLRAFFTVCASSRISRW
jgi:hypothetical protein